MLAKDVDWDMVEREYRAGIKTLREIGVMAGVTHGAVNQRAVKFGWTRNLEAKIKAKTQDLLSKKELSKKLSKITEQDIVLDIAQKQVETLEKESSEIQALSAICDINRENLKTCPGDLEKIIRMTKTVTETTEKLINLRRRNVGINDNATGEANKPPPYDRSLDPIDAYKRMVHGN